MVTTVSETIYTDRPVVGREVTVTRSSLGQTLDAVGDEYGLSYDPLVHVTVSDVDWGETRTIPLRVSTMKAVIAELE